jgi:recombination protein RecT
MASKTTQATQPAPTTLAQPETPQPANQLAPIDHIRAGLEKMTPNLAVALPKHIPVERFKRTVVTALNLNPDLLDADRRSLFNAATKAAQDGLLPDGREGALVIFKEKDKATGSFNKKVQWMPMVFGIIRKLRQSGEIASITARVVYKNEFDQGRFRYVISEGEERLEHEPILVGERGPAVLVYASAKFKDGTIQHEPLTMEDVSKARKVSRTGDKEYGPWAQWTDEMMRKTAIRRLSKYLPLSAEDNRMLDRDLSEAVDTDFEVQKKAAIAAPQSLDAARLLGAPAEEPPHDAETGEVIEAETVEQPAYEPGAEG